MQGMGSGRGFRSERTVGGWGKDSGNGGGGGFVWQDVEGGGSTRCPCPAYLTGRKEK
jgi:hypothetical protein